MPDEVATKQQSKTANISKGSFERHPRHREDYSRFDRIKDRVWDNVGVFKNQPLGQSGVVLMIGFVLLAIFGDFIAPYEASTRHYDAQMSLRRVESPSMEHLFGTTAQGRDIFSQTVISARASLIVGLLTAVISVGLGTAVGIVSAFYGGRVDDVLMRITDIAYGVPLIPFLIVVVIIFRPGLVPIIIGISFLMWRSTARVIRSQVLSLKERPYIESARSAGASDYRIMRHHLLPNVLPLAYLYGAFAIGTGILAEASISFLGFGDPSIISWGGMIHLAYTSGTLREAWWWAIAPSIALSVTVMSAFLIARAYETVVNPDLEASKEF